MFFKKFKKQMICLLLSFIIIPSSVFAYSDYLIPGGENVGIEIQSSKVMIVGLYEINGVYPAKEAGLEVGDTIKKINSQEIHSIDELVSKINQLDNLETSVTYERDNKEYETTLKIFKENQTLKTGLYVKDSITGIGTLSFIDPNTKLFGALGHEVIESTTGQILEVKNGKIFDSIVTNIERSENGNPGSKNAELKFDNKQGDIKENTIRGIFGTFTKNMPNKKTYKVANIEDIKKGEAKILTVLDGTEIKEYTINILKISKNDETKNLLFEITDEELLQKTGGVIQGMSGSPIIQDDYIIGAVTHVVVDNTKRGYGILITNMLEEAEN